MLRLSQIETCACVFSFRSGTPRPQTIASLFHPLSSCALKFLPTDAKIALLLSLAQAQCMIFPTVLVALVSNRICCGLALRLRTKTPTGQNLLTCTRLQQNRATCISWKRTTHTHYGSNVRLVVCEKEEL